MFLQITTSIKLLTKPCFPCSYLLRDSSNPFRSFVIMGSTNKIIPMIPEEPNRTDQLQNRVFKEKNKAFQASIVQRLKLTDPTSLTAIRIQSSMPPTVVPISFRGVVPFVLELWKYFESIAPRPFASFNTVQNRNIFLKSFLFLREAKDCYSHINCNLQLMCHDQVTTTEVFSLFHLIVF